MNCDDLISELCSWIYSYTFSNVNETDELVKFTYEMQREIDRLGFGYKVAEGKSAVTYCGKTDNGWVFKDFQTWTKNDSFSYAYISNTEAGKILNSSEVEMALKEVVGKNNYQAILWGDSNGIVGTATDILDDFGNPIGEVTCLNNVISEGYVRNLSGDILSLTYGQMDGKAWVLAELPTILSENKVTSINGIPMEELQSMYRMFLESGATEAEAIMDLAKVE